MASCSCRTEEPWTHIAKSIEVRFAAGSIAVTSSLTNKGAWPIEMAVWSLFLGAPNGRLILPVVQRNAGLLPNAHYALWSYARLDDPRVHWGQRYVVLDHDAANDAAFKLGYANEAGWLAYLNNGCCLVKRFRHEPGRLVPGRGMQRRGLHGRLGDRHRIALSAAVGGAGEDHLARRGMVRVRLPGAPVDRRRRDRRRAGAVRTAGRVCPAGRERRRLGPYVGGGTIVARVGGPASDEVESPSRPCRLAQPNGSG